MAKVYQWVNTKTNEYRETDSYDTPPTKSKHWKRIYSLGIGNVPGAGGSPVRSYHTRS